MSREDFEQLDASMKDAPKKKKMTVEKFFQQFNTLDMNNYGTWPLSVKITCWLFLFFVVCAIGYFLAIKPKMNSIDQARTVEQNLLNEFKEKDSKLRNLQQYQAQLQQMEMNFNQQFSVHDKFHRTLILSGFCLLKIAKISLNSSFFPKPIKR